MSKFLLLEKLLKMSPIDNINSKKIKGYHNFCLCEKSVVFFFLMYHRDERIEIVCLIIRHSPESQAQN